jgi:hypothetical protein
MANVKRVGIRAAGMGLATSGAILVLATMGGTALASGSPTPSSTTAPPPAAGFTTTVLSQTVSPSTQTQTLTASSDGANVSISIPAGAFGNQTVEVVVTEPTLSQLSSAESSLGLTGYSLATGVGIEVIDPSTGQPLSGTFAAPIQVTIVSSSITSSSKIIEFPATGSPFVVTNAEVVGGKAVVSIDSDPGFAVATPVSATVPQATSPVTGKNFLPEGVAGAVLLLAGSSLVALSSRRHRA